MGVVIYTKSWCPYCKKAKNLLERKKLEYNEIEISDNEELRQEMIENSDGRTTVPQVFIDGKHIGGYSELSQYNFES